MSNYSLYIDIFCPTKPIILEALAKIIPVIHIYMLTVVFGFNSVYCFIYCF
jgi:hypothetical protein